MHFPLSREQRQIRDTEFVSLWKFDTVKADRRNNLALNVIYPEYVQQEKITAQWSTGHPASGLSPSQD